MGLLNCWFGDLPLKQSLRKSEIIILSAYCIEGKEFFSYSPNLFMPNSDVFALYQGHVTPFRMRVHGEYISGYKKAKNGSFLVSSSGYSTTTPPWGVKGAFIKMISDKNLSGDKYWGIEYDLLELYDGIYYEDKEEFLKQMSMSISNSFFEK